MLSTAYRAARSVLIHCLPGMALLAHRHCPVPPATLAVVERWSPAVAAWAGARTVAVEVSGSATEGRLLWTAAAPMAFYAAWQLVYWLIVQARTSLTPCACSPRVLTPKIHNRRALLHSCSLSV